MAPIALFVRCTTDKAMGEKKYSTAFVSKELIDRVQSLSDDRESTRSCCDFGSDEVPCIKLWKSFSIHLQRM